MIFRNDFQKGSARAERRSGGGRVTVVDDGDIGGLVLIGLYLPLGGGPGQLGQPTGVQNNQSSQTAQQSPGEDPCKTGEDANSRINCRTEFTGVSVNRAWEKQLPAQVGIEYTNPGLVLSGGSTQPGCGAASSSIGPFYCLIDQTAYFNTELSSTLEHMGGGNGPPVQEYVMAHEFGHYTQKLEGTPDCSNYNKPGPDSDAVKIGPQADCYTGIWAHHTDRGPDVILEPLSDEQVADALKTTEVTGDDIIQQHSGGDVQPDSWTHGSVEQRTKAFLTGYKPGKVSQCDTLKHGVYS